MLERALAGEERPSKKLLEHVGGILEGRADYVLLDEQLIAFDRVIAETDAALKGNEGGVILIKGGPGTGKSVIALNLLTELSKRGASAHYATGSKSFRNSLHKIVGRRASQVFTYFSHYYDKEADSFDVVICDEVIEFVKQQMVAGSAKRIGVESHKLSRFLMQRKLPSSSSMICS